MKPIEHKSFALLVARARREGLRTFADFARQPVRLGGIWYAEVRP